MADEGVTYSFKDLFDKLDLRLNDGFGRLEGQIAEMRRSLEGKADNTRVAALEVKHGEFELKVDERFRPLETALIGTTAVSKVKDKGLVFLSGVVIAIISALTYLAATGGFH